MNRSCSRLQSVCAQDCVDFTRNYIIEKKLFLKMSAWEKHEQSEKEFQEIVVHRTEILNSKIEGQLKNVSKCSLCACISVYANTNVYINICVHICQKM